jgi:hypothetical protein
VPLICAGQGIAKDSVVHSAVSTVDLAPTFLDFAGVLDTAPPGMSRFSLRGVLQAPTTVAPLRQTVEFGLNNFRGVVRTLNDTHTLKFFCCSAAAGGCPGSTPADRAGFSNTTDEYHLFNIANDRFETPVRETHAIFLMITCQDRLGANTRTTDCNSKPPGVFRTQGSELRHEHRDVVEHMAALLPPRHETAANPHSSVKSQSYGYRWPGCVL